jgi:hypothetical protein
MKKKRTSSVHVSDAQAQRDAETHMLSSLARRLKLDIVRKDERIGELRGLKPDAIDWKKRVIVEVYARLGKLKGAQPRKVQGDILKLIYHERMLGGKWRKILCFADETAANTVVGKSWGSFAAKEFGVEVMVEHLPTASEKRVRAAQHDQRMVNPA